LPDGTLASMKIIGQDLAGVVHSGLPWAKEHRYRAPISFINLVLSYVVIVGRGYP
jgi:hypothetical protein